MIFLTHTHTHTPTVSSAHILISLTEHMFVALVTPTINYTALEMISDDESYRVRYRTIPFYVPV